MRVSGLGPKAEHHLLELGFNPRPTPAGGWRLATAPGGPGPLTVEPTEAPHDDGAIGDSVLGANREETAQAACGLMHLYGLREGAGPRRLGLDHTAVVRAVVTGQGALAGLLARARGLNPGRVRVDPTAALLLTLGHYLAIAEAAPETYTPRAIRTERADGTDRTALSPRADAGLPPPFLTRDGHWVEIETFRAQRWGALWQRLGVDGVAIGRAWREHAARQWTARCTLPRALHRAVAAHSLAELQEAARACEVAVVELQPPARYRPCARPWTSRTGPVPAVPVGEPARTSVPHDLPLAGLTVVECTRFLQGPYAGRVLAMLGAHVVLVELPDGDPARGIEPVVDGCFAGFRALHRGKHPVRLNVITPAGRDALRELLGTADVFLHNWPAGRAERLGLEPEALWRTHPRLICAHASGWAPFRGPLLPPVASDWSAQAHSGLAHAQRPDDEPPAAGVATLLDTLGGLTCAEAVLAALLRRETTGVSTAVETSLLSAARLLLNGAKRPPAGPLFHPLPTGEGHLALGDTPGARSALGLPPGADRRAFVHALAGESAANWEKHLNASGAPCARVRSIHDVLTDPALAGRLAYENGVHVTAPWEFS
ncbi:CoA transferase [Streptomyces murinus]|uniref:CoA transferase n=1 Tax=Streptomyces murinus TaxID=33900 RepID=UPI00364543D2